MFHKEENIAHFCLIEISRGFYEISVIIFFPEKLPLEMGHSSDKHSEVKNYQLIIQLSLHISFASMNFLWNEICSFLNEFNFQKLWTTYCQKVRLKAVICLECWEDTTFFLLQSCVISNILYTNTLLNFSFSLFDEHDNLCSYSYI